MLRGHSSIGLIFLLMLAAGLVGCSMFTHSKLRPAGLHLRIKAPSGWRVDTARHPTRVLLRNPNAQQGMHVLVADTPLPPTRTDSVLQAALRQQHLARGYRALPAAEAGDSTSLQWLFGRGEPGTPTHQLMHGWAWHWQQQGRTIFLLGWAAEGRPGRFARFYLKPTRKSIRLVEAHDAAD